MTYDFERLKKNLSDMIFEGIVKIGAVEGSAISVYYDAGLLEYLLGKHLETPEETRECLTAFKEYVKPYLGELVIKRIKNRFEFMLTRAGAAYIYEHNDGREFLFELIQVLNQPVCTIEEVKNVFLKRSDEVIIEKINHSEFQYIVYFKDKSIDEFKYCVTFDEMGHYYHRLLDYDFEKVMRH